MDKRIEGPFNGAGGRFPDHLNKCGSCEEEIKGDKEYRRTYNEELFNKTGGREGRTYYCVPCGERISAEEVAQESKEREKYKSEKEQSAQKVIQDCLVNISQLEQNLSQGGVAGTIDNYKKIKNIEKRIKNLGNFEDPIIKGDIENLKKSCLDLINEYISPKDRKIGNSKQGNAIHAPCCTSRSIRLEENDSEQYYYCDYCWETESPKFLRSLKSYCIDRLNKKMLDNGISSFELNSSNYQSMLTVPDFLLTQEGIKDTYQKAEKDLEELLKKRGINVPQQKQNNNVNNPVNNISNNKSINIRHREREREREQIQSQQSQLQSEITQLEQNPTKNQSELNSKKQQLKDLQDKEKQLTASLPIDTQISLLEREIKNLENKVGKTKAEQSLLDSKKKELAELLRKQSNSSNTNDNKNKGNNTALYWGIGIVGTLLVLGIFIIARIRKRKLKG